MTDLLRSVHEWATFIAKKQMLSNEMMLLPLHFTVNNRTGAVAVRSDVNERVPVRGTRWLQRLQNERKSDNTASDVRSA